MNLILVHFRISCYTLIDCTRCVSCSLGDFVFLFFYFLTVSFISDMQSDSDESLAFSLSDQLAVLYPCGVVLYRTANEE